MSRPKFGMSMLIGESITGLPAPIFFDPHYCIFQNKPPVTLITGSPGSGKTFAASILAGHSSVLNKLTFVIDPKGDFLSLKKLERNGEINKTDIWSVFSNEDQEEISEENYGILDPLTLTDNVDNNVGTTVDVIESLVKKVTHKQSNALVPIVRDVAESRNPSMAQVIRMLIRNQDEEIRNLGIELEVPCKMSLAKLIVADSKTKRNPFARTDGMLIISLMGLTLPDNSSDKENYSHKERLSTVIMKLITELVVETLMKVPKNYLKTLFVDEAWVVYGNKSGQGLIDKTALLGRSYNVATILATQSPSHISGGAEGGKSSLDNTISTRFAFRNTSDIDNSINRQAMRLPENDDWETVFTKLATGQCIMKDCNDNLAVIHILTSKEWQDCFNTNPLAALKPVDTQ